jgi:hypothetical protein
MRERELASKVYMVPERALTPLKQVLRKPVLSLADDGGGGRSALLSPAPVVVVVAAIAGFAAVS